jgi:hypothetical protein
LSQTAKKRKPKSGKKKKKNPEGKFVEEGEHDAEALTSSDSVSLRRPPEREKSKKGNKGKKEKQQGGGQDNVNLPTGTMETETKPKWQKSVYKP